MKNLALSGFFYFPNISPVFFPSLLINFSMKASLKSPKHIPYQYIPIKSLNILFKNQKPKEYRKCEEVNNHNSRGKLEGIPAV